MTRAATIIGEEGRALRRLLLAATDLLSPEWRKTLFERLDLSEWVGEYQA